MSPSANKNKGLGKGFGALISDDFDKSLILSNSDRIEKIELDKIQANPNQPRRHFDEKALKELSESIKQHGIIQPLVVTPIKDGKYTIIAGERRWRASHLAKLITVPVIIRSSKGVRAIRNCSY